jgi:hypothetical protein
MHSLLILELHNLQPYKKIFSTFEEFPFNHKIYLRNNSTLDVCGKALSFHLVKWDYYIY